MNHFYEQLVTTNKTSFYKTVNVATVIFGCIGIACFNINIILAIVLLGVAIAGFFYKQQLFVEYEYQFTEGEINIVKIIDMKKRSRITTFNIKEVGLLAPEESDAVEDYGNKPKNISRCYPVTSKARVYVAMVMEGNNKMQLRFVPDEKFLENCYKYNPRAVKKVI